MKIKKILLIAIVLVVCITVFAACTAENNTADTVTSEENSLNTVPDNTPSEDSVSVSASSYCGLDDYNDYINEDGTYTYFFNQGITVTMPEEWYMNTIVKGYEDRALICHKESYEKYKDEGIENGGILFTISYSVNSDFSDLNEMTYIGFDEDTALNYFALKPTDYPAYPDKSTEKGYDALFSSCDGIIAGIKILSASEGNNSTAYADTARTPSSEEYCIYGNDFFTFECGTEWSASDSEEGIILRHSTGKDIPQISITPVVLECTADEKVANLKNDYIDTYKNRLAAEPEIITYEPVGTDRKLIGITERISSEDGIEVITSTDYFEEIDGQYFKYTCSYVSTTYAADSHEDENTYFEFMHAIDTLEL